MAESMVDRVMAEGWEFCDALAATYGPSFYLADPSRLAGNVEEMLSAFRDFYPRTSIAYSYKTNYLPTFISVASDLGAYSEVVSRFEYDYAIGLGVAEEKIIFNGPGKAVADMSLALSRGACVNLDSLAELRGLLATPGEIRNWRVGLRCYLGPAETPGSRFGIDPTDPESRVALSALDDSGLRLAGLHCHHSGDRSPERYRGRIRALVGLHRGLLGGRPLDFINIGGGFCSRMSPKLARELGISPASYRDYAECVARVMWSAYGEDGPELVLEPGMAILADTMAFVTQVVALKSVGSRRLAVVDGSVFNVKPLRGPHNPSIGVVPRASDRAAEPGPWELVGHTCMEVDLLHTGHDHPTAVGDYLVFENVGAYTNVLNPPFIRGTPPILALDGGNEVLVLRHSSTPADLIASYGVAT